MPTPGERNVEIKATVPDFAALKTKAEQLSQSQGTLLVQTDTYFKVPNSRLKLRELQGATAQLVTYKRLDMTGPKLSEYHVSSVSNPEDLKVTLSRALGVTGVVAKRRMLYMVGQTRIHLDQVKGLGDFMELEVTLKPDETTEQGKKIAYDLMAQLGIQEKDLMTCSYMDLTLEKAAANGNGVHVPQ